MCQRNPTFNNKNLKLARVDYFQEECAVETHSRKRHATRPTCTSRFPFHLHKREQFGNPKSDSDWLVPTKIQASCSRLTDNNSGNCSRRRHNQNQKWCHKSSIATNWHHHASTNRHLGTQVGSRPTYVSHKLDPKQSEPKSYTYTRIYIYIYIYILYIYIYIYKYMEPVRGPHTNARIDSRRYILKYWLLASESRLFLGNQQNI